MRVGRHRRDLAPGIGEEAQLAAGRHLGVELPQRAGSGVARVDVERLALRRHFGVERGKIGFRHVDFAAHLDHIGRARRQRLRDHADGADIGGDIFAGRAVAARGGRYQPAVLVTQRHRQTVDLRLRRERDRIVRKLPEEAIDRCDEIAGVFV
ncbi:hypothetical protein D9M70_583760 [compost metagenome]